MVLFMEAIQMNPADRIISKGGKISLAKFNKV